MKKNAVQKNPSILLIGLFPFLFIFLQCQIRNENLSKQSRSTNLQTTNTGEIKQKGVHVFGRLDSTDFEPLLQTNIEWITLVPYGYQEKHDSPVVKHIRRDSSFTRRRDARWVQRIKLARAAGFKVFVKPHIWMGAPPDGKWRSDIFPANEENWELWKESYRAFIFRYAKIAENSNAEMFCIGTELTRLSSEKPDFWRTLIQEVRGIYSGKITYAANWYKEFEKIDFWEDLEYIGIQAYFPLVKNEYPSVEQLSDGWLKHLSAIESIHKKYHRKILFTEMGYKSTADSAIKPWEWIDRPPKKGKRLSMETQANCYEAFFDTVWKKDWLAGVHLWEWRGDFIEENGKGDFDFTPRGKPAKDIIAKGFE